MLWSFIKFSQIFKDMCIDQCGEFVGGLWDFKDILNSRQNRSKNILVRENAVTRVHGSCSLQIMGS